MSRSAETTIIFLGTDRIARADFAAGPVLEPVHEWQAARPVEQELEHCLDMVLASGPRCGRNVWILCELLWTQSLSLPAAAVAGLSAADIERALSFELESLSGLTAGESRVVFQACGGDNGKLTFWVTQVSQNACEQMRSAVRHAGGRLRGLCHPGGLPMPWQSDADGNPWWRIESWGDVTLCLSADAGGSVTTHSVSGNCDGHHWSPAITQWLNRVEPRALEFLDRGRSTQPAALNNVPSLVPLPALQDKDLQRWLALWAQALSKNETPIPVVKPSPPKSWTRQVLRVPVLAVVAVVLICVAHGWMMTEKADTAWAQVAQAERPGIEARALDKQIKTLTEQWQALRKKSSSSADVDPMRVLSRQKTRLAAVLDALSHLVHKDRVITSLASGDQGAVTISGLALQSGLADEFAIDLRRMLASEGWSLRGAEKVARRSRADGGPWEFRITLIPETERVSDSPFGQEAGPSLAGVPTAGAKR